MTWRGSTTIPERVFACLPYLLPLIEGINFGVFLFKKFPLLALIFQPLTPLIMIYNMSFVSLIIFFVLYLAVVRNENINHFIRFNAMQAILVDIIVILSGIVLQILVKGLPSLFVIETLYNVVFLGILATVGYAIFQSVQGRYAEIPSLSDAVYMQVR